MDRLRSDYQQHHQSQGNRTCHTIGIPLIGPLWVLNHLFHVRSEAAVAAPARS